MTSDMTTLKDLLLQTKLVGLKDCPVTLMGESGIWNAYLQLGFRSSRILRGLLDALVTIEQADSTASDIARRALREAGLLS
jgi:hypothetical protein